MPFSARRCRKRRIGVSLCNSEDQWPFHPSVCIAFVEKYERKEIEKLFPLLLQKYIFNILHICDVILTFFIYVTLFFVTQSDAKTIVHLRASFKVCFSTCRLHAYDENGEINPWWAAWKRHVCRLLKRIALYFVSYFPRSFSTNAS